MSLSRPGGLVGPRASVPHWKSKPRIGEDLGAGDFRVGLSEPRARGDELRRSRPEQLDELQISGRAGKVE